MPHLSDGELHAYLDGALEQLERGASERIREHLEQCAGCRSRLDEERVLHERADALLAGAAPARVAVPSFEELRRRAQDGSPTPDVNAPRSARPWTPPWGLAWAATLVLALGVGWASRGVLGPGSDVARERFVGATASAPVADAAADVSEDARRAEAEEAVAELTDRVRQSAPDAAAGAPSARMRAQAQADPPRPEEDRLADAERSAVAGGAVPAAPPVPETVRELRAEPRAASADRAKMDAEAEPAAASSALPSDAPDTEPLAVPGLDVLVIEPDAGVPGQPGVRILQRLHQGDTLELRYFGILSATDAGLGESRPGRIRMRDLPNPALEPGWSQVVMRRGSGWLVARAPMSRESLQFLLRMLQ